MPGCPPHRRESNCMCPPPLGCSCAIVRGAYGVFSRGNCLLSAILRAGRNWCICFARDSLFCCRFTRPEKLHDIFFYLKVANCKVQASIPRQIRLEILNSPRKFWNCICWLDQGWIRVIWSRSRCRQIKQRRRSVLGGSSLDREHSEMVIYVVVFLTSFGLVTSKGESLPVNTTSRAIVWTSRSPAHGLDAPLSCTVTTCWSDR